MTLLAVLAAVLVPLYILWRQRQDTALLERRHQANLIACWFDAVHYVVWIENRSEQPIHDVAISLLLPQAGEPRSLPLHGTGGVFPAIPPRHRIHLTPRHTPKKRDLILVFQDANGITWKRDDRSALEELGQDIFTYYDLSSRESYNYLLDRPEPLDRP